MSVEEAALLFLVRYVIAPQMGAWAAAGVFWAEYRRPPVWQPLAFGTTIGLFATVLATVMLFIVDNGLLRHILRGDSLVYNLFVPVALTVLVSVATWRLCGWMYRDGPG